jgi:phosphopantetheinyl transferase
MFRYVLVHASEHASLASAQAWPGLLSAQEEGILAGLRFAPRRTKWLLGRIAAKRLLGGMPGLEGVVSSRLSVLNRPSGEPFVLVEGVGEYGYPISISHRGEIGMAAAPEHEGFRIGADLETIEPRDPALARQFFTAREASLVEQAGDARDEVVARIWSAKEAVLKLLGLGLRLDTREIEVSLTGAAFAECPASWNPIDFSMGRGSRAALPTRSSRVVWRLEAGVVLTVAVAS